MKIFPVEVNQKKEYNCNAGKHIVLNDIFKEGKRCEAVRNDQMIKALVVGGEELIDCLYFCLALLSKGAQPQEACLAFFHQANCTSQEIP